MTKITHIHVWEKGTVVKNLVSEKSKQRLYHCIAKAALRINHSLTPRIFWFFSSTGIDFSHNNTIQRYRVVFQQRETTMRHLIPSIIQEQYPQQTYEGHFDALTMLVDVPDCTPMTPGRH